LASKVGALLWVRGATGRYIVWDVSSRWYIGYRWVKVSWEVV